jgi:tetratricopeptide (TPR) repeat protein
LDVAACRGNSGKPERPKANHHLWPPIFQIRPEGQHATRHTSGENGVNPYLILILIALLYTLVVGGLSALRREGLSLQFAIEVIVVASLLIGLSLISGEAMHPVLFLAVIYLVSMRARLLVDLGNLLARRGYHNWATKVYHLALNSRPDDSGRQIVTLNQAVHRLKQGQLTDATAMLEGLVADSQNPLGPKYEAAARYNLGVAYRRQGKEAKATVEFNKVIDVMPGSVYASGAQIALEKGKRQKETSENADPDQP